MAVDAARSQHSRCGPATTYRPCSATTSRSARTQLALDGAEIARELGHRGMYHWLIAHATFGVRAEARDWDAHMERLREALESATVRSDRMRLRSYLSVLESSRGEGLETIGIELTEMLGDSVDPDDQFAVAMGMSYAALLSGDTDTAYSLALEAEGLATQSPEGATWFALRRRHLGRRPRKDEKHERGGRERAVDRRRQSSHPSGSACCNRLRRRSYRRRR